MRSGVQVHWRSAGTKARIWALVVLLGGGLAISLWHAVPQVRHFAEARPAVCLMKYATGVPCLACRGTRAAMAIADGNLPGAFRYNPLASVFVLSVLGLVLMVGVGGKWPDTQWDPVWMKLGIVILVLALLGNWAYVIVAGG